jgi:hypothetical protein
VSQHLTMIGSVYGGYLTTSLEFQSVGSIRFFLGVQSIRLYSCVYVVNILFQAYAGKHMDT